MEVIKMNENKTNINWYPGHMAKTKREIKEKLALIDVIYEVIDARMPQSSKIVDIDELVKDKPRILIMSKYDLCDRAVTDSFIRFYQEQGYRVVPVDLLHGKDLDKILAISHELMEKNNRERAKKGLKPRNIRALIVGVPNVGKSTLINRLVGRKATTVGDRPGVTKALGWIRIHKDIELLDSPGILWPKIEDAETALILAAFSSIKEELLDLQEISAFVLRKLHELYPSALEKRYGISSLGEDLTEVYEAIGKKNGCLGKGGIVLFEKVYALIVRDLKEGRFGPVTFDRFEKK